MRIKWTQTALAKQVIVNSHYTRLCKYIMQHKVVAVQMNTVKWLETRKLIYSRFLWIADSTQVGRTGGCFSGNSTVETPSGPRKISDIRIGDKIMSLNSDGQQVFSDVLLFLDRNRTETREFFQLRTASGKSITLTPSHLIYTVQPESLTPEELFLFKPNSFILSNQTGQMFLDKAVVSFAKFVQIGDWVLVFHSNASSQEASSSYFSIEKVVDMSAKVETGVYAPLTSEGNLIVDGVLSSCYAVIDDQELDHWVFLPVRLSHNFVQGLSYAWRKFSHFITFRHHDDNNDIHDHHQNQDHHHHQRESSARFSSSSSKSGDNTGGGLQEEDDVLGDQGVHWYAQALYTVSKFLLPSHLHYDGV